MRCKYLLIFLTLLMVACNKNDDDDGGNNGGNDNCQWEKSSNKIELISVSMGSECGNDPTSIAVMLKNVSDKKVRLAICFQMDVRQDPAGWSIQNHSMEPGETKKLSICEYSTGEYKYWAMDYSGNESCEQPNCNS